MAIMLQRRLPRNWPAMLVALWSFAEACLFFIVADVALTVLAISRPWRQVWPLPFIAAFAAIVGGWLLYALAGHDMAAIQTVVIALPAIDAALMNQAMDDYAGQGFVAMLSGAFSGVPYKLYVLGAVARDSGYGLLALHTFGARLPRYFLAAVLAAIIAWLLRRLPDRVRIALMLLFWVIFYGWYFSTMP